MSGRTLRFERFAPRIDALRRWIDQHLELLMIGALIILAGALLAILAAQLDEGEQIGLGNTTGTLSALITVENQRIMVGAGPSRSHAADFLGRSTRPWDRAVDLLIIPGWDDQHTVGALGLIERGSVRSIAVVGLPGEEPSWTLLERNSEQADVPIVFLDRPHQLELSSDSRLLLAGSGNNSDEGAWVRLEHHGKRIDLIDASRPARFNPDPRAFSPRNDHVVINMRGSQQPDKTEPTLLVIPRPHWQWDVSNIQAPFWTGIERNQRLTMQLTDGEIRLPREIIETGTTQ